MLALGAAALMIPESLFAQSARISESEADQIVSQQAQEAEARKQERLERHADLRVIRRTEVDKGDHKVIFERVVPPEIEPTPALSPTEGITTTDVTASTATFQPEKPVYSLAVSGTIYDHAISELRWNSDGAAYQAFSNVDFNHLRSAASFATPEASFSFLLIMDNQPWGAYPDPAEGARIKAELDQLTEPGYVVFAQPGRRFNDEAFVALEALLAYYEDNAKELAVIYENTVALQAARERYEAANPKQPEDVIIKFWPIDAATISQP